MKFLKPIAALLAATPFTNAYWKGFNMGANNPDGSCKTQAQWESDFRRLQQLPGNFTSVRLYTTTDCDTLTFAVPAAISTGTHLLVGVWTENATHFQQEKDALEVVIRKYGQDWIVAISVGSEDLYRNDTNADTLAQQIYDVRNMVRSMGVDKEVGHVDTWGAWVDGANTAVIKASDFLGVDAYPYFEGSTIEDASSTFWTAINKVRNVVDKVSPGKWIWVTETGWPITGSNFGNAVPSVENARTYWQQVACQAFSQVHMFWYIYQDFVQKPSFGVIDRNGDAIYDLKSC
jgi:exo-beta-1,3-glucanase (GH17 family)